MRRGAVALLAVVLAVSGSVACGRAERRDPVRPVGGFAGGPSRIVSLVPAATQMLYAMGAGPQIVGVSTYDREPAQVRDLPRVGGLLDPDTERILALHPDLVVIYGGQQELEARLSSARVPMFTYRHGDLAGVSATLRALGKAAGHEREAEAAALGISTALQRIAARVQNRPRPRTLVVIGRDARSLQGLLASGGYGFLHDMVVTAGGLDVFEDVKRESLPTSAEAVLARQPDVIVELKYGTAAIQPDGLTAWERLPSVPAVKNGRLYQLVGDEFVEAGPGIAVATEKLSRVLQPDAWK